jgi:hypothetical protein
MFPVNERKPIFLRAHTEILKRPKSGRRKATNQDSKPPAELKKSSRQPKWPACALVIDCESTRDKRQRLTLACYRFCTADSRGRYTCVEEGLFYPDDLPERDPQEMSALQQYARDIEKKSEEEGSRLLHLRCRSEFMEEVFWNVNRYAEGLVVGFNLPFDLSRVALDNKKARSRNERWSFVMFEDIDPESGQVREDPFRPRVIVTPKDSKAAFIRFAGISARSKETKQRLIPYMPGRFLDLRTFGWALRNESYSLQKACEAFGVPGKLDHEPSGRITREEIDYCREDVRATMDLLNALRSEFDRHPIDLFPDRAFSPASIAKAYLKAMGLEPPSKKFNIPGSILGAAMQSYYGGRAEARIRRTFVPTVLTDFMSEYPTCNILMGLWSMLTAETLRVEDATDSVRDLLEHVTPDRVLDQAFWKDLTFFALVQPNGDVLPVRTAYAGKATNIGVNPLTSPEPIYYTGPDLVASTLLTGRPPKVLQAFRVVAQGKQAGLKPVSLRGMIQIDPTRDDFFKVTIESRARVRIDSDLSKNERDALAYFLKILANAGSYGLFVEVNPARVGTDPKTGKPARAELRVFSGDQEFEQTSPVVEESGLWYCPVFAALITAGGRLLLALLERMVTDAGGNYLMCDTDSMAIVASEGGSLVPCAGGGLPLPDGAEGIKALSFADVGRFVCEFERLNPYDRSAVTEPILKIEKVNFSADGKQREVLGYAIAAKRYVLPILHVRDGVVRIEICTASAHGLGFLYPPHPGFDSSANAPNWVVEAWEWILKKEAGLPCEDPDWFQLPGMMRFTITTPQILKVLQARQQELPYSERAKPFGFIQSPLIDRLTGGYPIGVDLHRFTLIGSFSAHPSEWLDRMYMNVHDGKSYRLRMRPERMPFEAEATSVGEIVDRYRWHPESKSLAPDGTPCTRRTHGLLQRSPVTADGVRYIGKETDRRWEQGAEISMLETFTLEYRPNETERLTTDPELQRKVREHSIRALATTAGVSTRTVKAARDGKRLRKSTIDKLEAALRSTLPATRPRALRSDPPFTLDDLG